MRHDVKHNQSENPTMMIAKSRITQFHQPFLFHSIISWAVYSSEACPEVFEREGVDSWD
jgi:hypothetical protein